MTARGVSGSAPARAAAVALVVVAALAAAVPQGSPALASAARPIPLLAGAAQEAADTAATAAGRSVPLPSGIPAPSREAIARYREIAQESDRPRDWFNLGAALLAAGDLAGARPPLSRAVTSGEGRVRRDAYYDLGVADASEGRHAELSGGARRSLLLRARDGFRAVVRADPADEDARWNLELVERWLESESGGGGGGPEDAGGGGGGGETGGAAASASTGEEAPSLTRREAEELLEAAARAEQGVQEKRLDRERSRDPVVERDW